MGGHVSGSVRQSRTVPSARHRLRGFEGYSIYVVIDNDRDFLHSSYTMNPSPGSPVKAELAALVSVAKDGLLVIEDAPRALGLTSADAASRLARLAKAGWLARVRRGLYYVLPVDAPASERTAYPDPWILAARAFVPCYVGGWSAAEYWGLTEQLFRSTFVATAAPIRSWNQRLLGLDFHLVRVRPERLLGVNCVWRGASTVAVSSVERTLVDGFRDPAWLGGFRHASECLHRYIESTTDKGMAALLGELSRSGNGAAAKRIGFILEHKGASAEVIDQLRQAVTRGLTRLDPAIRQEGRINKRWGLIINASFV